MIRHLPRGVIEAPFPILLFPAPLVPTACYSPRLTSAEERIWPAMVCVLVDQIGLLVPVADWALAPVIDWAVRSVDYRWHDHYSGKRPRRIDEREWARNPRRLSKVRPSSSPGESFFLFALTFTFALV